MTKDLGVPPSGSGLRPFGAEPATQSQAKPLVPNAGDYVVFCEYGDKFTVKQVDKVTPALVKFAGRQWPRQFPRDKLLASFAGREAAEFFKQGVDGIMGEFNRRKRVADAAHGKQVSAARDAADKSIARLLASAMSAFGQDPKGLEAKPASAAPEGGDAQ